VRTDIRICISPGWTDNSFFVHACVCMCTLLVVEEITSSKHCQVSWRCSVVRGNLCYNRESNSITACHWFTHPYWNMLWVIQYHWGSFFLTWDSMLLCLYV